MNYKLEILAGQYAYRLCGPSPCEYCKKFQNITTNKERLEFINCISEERCQEAKDYNAKYNEYIKEYKDKYGDNEG